MTQRKGWGWGGGRKKEERQGTKDRNPRKKGELEM